jgi:hypothetical protein
MPGTHGTITGPRKRAKPAVAGPLHGLVELSRYRGRIFPSPFMANIET